MIGEHEEELIRLRESLKTIDWGESLEDNELEKAMKHSRHLSKISVTTYRTQVTEQWKTPADFVENLKPPISLNLPYKSRGYWHFMVTPEEAAELFIQAAQLGFNLERCVRKKR